MHDGLCSYRKAPPMSTRCRMAVLVACNVLLFGCATDRPIPPQNWDGLEYRPGAGSGALYVYPDAEVGTFRSFLIASPVVVIDSNWNPEVSAPVGHGIAPGRLTGRDIQHIKDVVAREFRTMLAREVTGGGYQVVERADVDTAVVTTALVDLDMARSSSDRMTLVMELRDASTGAAFARFFDRQTGDMGVLRFPDSVTESDNFRRAAKDWGRRAVTITESVSQHPKTENRGVDPWVRFNTS
ncbi:MAG: hypothetical protein K0R70_1649 [Steroidobacteraceae bacterium]|nr:hypothetical protein [Steroidobacteraceae bacterium]